MANETARLGFVRRALRTLRKGKVATRQELFMGMPEEEGNRVFQRRVLRSLVACGAARKTTEKDEPGKSSEYILADADKLDEILESDENISDFIWPSNLPPPVAPPPPPEPVEEPQPAQQALVFLAPAPYIPKPGEVVPPIDKNSLDQTNYLLGELIETMHTALQSTIYTREGVDEIKKMFTGFEQRQAAVLERLEELVRKLS